jgi:phosphocarrier protein HPr
MGSPSVLTRTVLVRNAEGLHLRPAGLLVRVASSYSATIQIGYGGHMVDCKSILSLITLGAGPGAELSVMIHGDNAEAAMQEICELFESGFQEDNSAASSTSLAE